MTTEIGNAYEANPKVHKNRFDRMEWAGAFGDLGTLIPFVVAYISLLKMDPCGMLLAFGIAKIISGFYYKTPFPIQPMKAIGAIAATQAAETVIITPNAVYGAGVVTGVIWFLLGVTGAAKKAADLIGRQSRLESSWVSALGSCLKASR